MNNHKGTPAPYLNSIPYVDLYKSAKNIKTRKVPRWEQDCITFSKKMDRIDIEIRAFDKCFEKVAPEYRDHFKIIKSEVSEIETLLPEINTLADSNTTLISFVWDMQSPLLNEDFDNTSPKF